MVSGKEKKKKRSVSLEFVLFLEMDAGNRIDTEESGVEAQIQQVMKSAAKLTGQIDNFRRFYPS